MGICRSMAVDEHLERVPRVERQHHALPADELPRWWSGRLGHASFEVDEAKGPPAFCPRARRARAGLEAAGPVVLLLSRSPRDLPSMRAAEALVVGRRQEAGAACGRAGSGCGERWRQRAAREMGNG